MHEKFELIAAVHATLLHVT